MGNDHDFLLTKMQVDRLRSQKRRLVGACKNMRAMKTALEEALTACNRKLMQADLLNMELEQIFNNSTDPMWVIREDGVVVRVNTAMLDLFDRTKDQIIGWLCKDVFGEHCFSDGRCPVKTCKRSRMFHKYEIKRTLPSGEVRYFLVSTASLVTIDGLSGFVAQYKDISLLKNAEQMMEKANIELERLAGIDGLTGVANRRVFDTTIKKEWERLRRVQKPLSIILCDIDYFKAYNDTLGHQAGDDCLRKVAETLALCARRPADLVARYGGEEFVFLLPETPVAGAVEVAENALRNIAAIGLSHPGLSSCGTVTLSFGVAEIIPKEGSSFNVLVELADESLYRAKGTGRNRVCCAGEITDIEFVIS